MKTNRSDNAMQSTGSGLWARLGQVLGRSADESRLAPEAVTVWDDRQGCYRHVNLLDRHDSLWFAASALAAMRAAMPSKSAA